MSNIQDTFKLPGTEVEDKGDSMIIYGDPGVGKTSLIKTLLGYKVVDVPGETQGSVRHEWKLVNEPYCKPEEIFVIDVEAGELVLQVDGRRLVTTFRVEEGLGSTSEYLAPLVQYLMEGDHPIKFVFMDNMTELERFYLIAITKSKELRVPRQYEWMDTSYYMRRDIRNLRNLTYKGINVIFNFWSMIVPIEDKEGQKTCYESPMVMRSTTMEYVGLVDHTAYMNISKTGQRFLQFESNDRIKCKTRSEKIEQFEQADLANIFRKIKGGSDG